MLVVCTAYHFDQIKCVLFISTGVHGINAMQVKNEWLHNAGAGVIAHVADSIKQQESRKYFRANL
jgi:hypothetical protein